MAAYSAERMAAWKACYLAASTAAWRALRWVEHWAASMAEWTACQLVAQSEFRTAVYLAARSAVWWDPMRVVPTAGSTAARRVFQWVALKAVKMADWKVFHWADCLAA